MGNRITFDEICQQLCSIYRVTQYSSNNLNTTIFWVYSVEEKNIHYS